MPPRSVVSLLGTFSIDVVLTGTRISLAHLIELSTFVDLYVLEEKIYLDDFAIEHELAPFSQDRDTPLRRLPLGNLNFAVGKVSSGTTRIYDESPVPFTFSTGSYEFWTKLSEAERLAQPPWPVGPSGKGDPKWLMLESWHLHNAVTSALEELSLTDFTIVPSARNLVPFMEAFHQADTPALRLYQSVAAAHKKELQDLMSLTRPRPIYLPPLLGVLLSRCRSRDDIPGRLAELRQEFAPLRKDVAAWMSRLDEASSIADKLEITAELTNSIKGLTRRYENQRPVFYKEVAGALLSAAEDGDPVKAVTKPAFAIVKKGLESAIPDMFTTRRFTGFIDLMEESLRVEEYFSLLERVFGEYLDISQQELTQARAFQKLLFTRYSMSPVIPG